MKATIDSLLFAAKEFMHEEHPFTTPQDSRSFTIELYDDEGLMIDIAEFYFRDHRDELGNNVLDWIVTAVPYGSNRADHTVFRMREKTPGDAGDHRLKTRVQPQPLIIVQSDQQAQTAESPKHKDRKNVPLPGDLVIIKSITPPARQGWT